MREKDPTSVTAGMKDNVLDDIIAYEEGELDYDQIIELFQYLVDSGLAWQLQGSYGRKAMDLIAAGLVTMPEHDR